MVKQYSSTRSDPWIVGNINVNVLLSFVFGVVFLLVLLGFAALFRDPTPLLTQVMLTILSLSAGGIGAMLPGFLEIQHKSIFRAGGAIALAAMVYFNSPAVLSTTKNISNLINPVTPPSQDVALDFLKANDSNDIASVWSQLDPVAFGVTVSTQADYADLLKNARLPLGKVDTRIQTGTAPVPSNGMPEGNYRSIIFKTKFSAESNCRVEQLILHSPSVKTNWRVVSYLISPSNIPC